jgi:hypothetical protein
MYQIKRTSVTKRKNQLRSENGENRGRCRIWAQKKRLTALFSSGNLLAAWDAETLVEAVNTATGSNITLFAGVERVALAAYVEVQVVTYG